MINKFKKLAVTLSVLSVLASTASLAHGDNKMHLAKENFAKAEKQFQVAKKEGFAWNTTVKLLEQAEIAISKKNYLDANKYSVKALAEANHSLDQAKESKDNWQKNIIKWN